MGFTLEKYKAFPYIAWAVFIGFSVFVAGLAIELYNATNSLEHDSRVLERVVRDNSARIEVLESALSERAQ